MKNFISSRLFLVMVTAIIFTGVGVIAEAGINANMVSYTDTNNNKTNVKDALDNVYNSLDRKMALNTFGDPIYNVSQGDLITSRVTTVTLNKGKYLLSKVVANAYHSTSSSDNPTLTQMSNISNAISCDKNCVIVNLFSYQNRVKASGTIAASNNKSYYTIGNSTSHLFYVEVTDDNTIINGYATASSSVSTSTQQVSLVAIPINE